MLATILFYSGHITVLHIFISRWDSDSLLCLVVQCLLAEAPAYILYWPIIFSLHPGVECSQCLWLRLDGMTCPQSASEDKLLEITKQGGSKEINR